MTKLFWPLVAALVACRFYHFRTYLDHPHLFRQADTAFYTLGFHRYGMNIFTPSVGWLGDHRHVILEFPLTEWLAAWGYHLTGPTIAWDRLVNIGFFLGSAFFLFRIVTLVHDRALASIVTPIYMAAPLAIYYSRAVHVDFTAVCFAHAMLLGAMRLADAPRTRTFAAAVLAGALAFAVKAPYAFYLLLPALYYGWRRGAGVRRLGSIAAVFAASAAVFGGWFAYVQSVNRQTPDLSFVPSFFRHVDRFEWYFGRWSDRSTLEYWRTIVGRVYREIAVTVWWALVPFALVARARLTTCFGFALAWSAGSLVYLLAFFRLNEMHNYYQIPFIAPFSLWLGAAIYAAATLEGPRARFARAAATLALVGYAGSSMLVSAGRFYRTDPLHLEVGRFVQALTDEDDLVVMAYTDATHGDPSYLYYARRYGWSVGHHELSPAVIEGLRPHGASVVVTSTIWPPAESANAYLSGLPTLGELTVPSGRVTVHRLAPAADGR